MRLILSFAAALLGCALHSQALAQTVLPCTDTGAGYLYCMPPIGGNGGESAADRMNRESVQRGVNTMFPRPPTSQELADTAVGRAIAANPQQAGEDFTDYTLRVTRIARDGVAQRSPQASIILTSRLVELEDMKFRKQIADREAQRRQAESVSRPESEHSHTDAEIAQARTTAFNGCLASGRDPFICKENADQVATLMRDGVL